MIVATVLFIAGSFWYRKPPPKDNIFGEVFRLGARAISNKVKAKEPSRNHWLEYFLDTHDCQRDAKCIELQKKIRKEDACQKPRVREFQVVPDHVISILWQVPQIVTLTAAEVLFSVTGYEFAYTQCAPSMKALVQAAWLLTTAAGDTIFAFVQLWIPFDNMAVEFLAFAGFMTVVVVIFALMCTFYYEYNYYVGEMPSDKDDNDAECSSETGGSERSRIASKATFTERF
ncbi:CRE-PEPT-1 protein [Aphelenchoides avenae]|nr:CRE-PEPT-1 protein [Aphelenchus avenae]